MKQSEEKYLQNEEKYIPALGFDFLTPFYDRTVRWTTRETIFKEKLAKQIKIPKGGRLLDLACGTATLTIALRKKFPEGEIFGLDGDAKILQIARRKASENDSAINFSEGYSTAMLYPDGYFDVIVSSLFFHHLTPANKTKTLLEAKRVLKADGKLHIADWGKPSNLLMKIASVPIQWLDGATTKDSFAGRLPEMLSETGFSGIAETAAFDTVFGTIRLHRADLKIKDKQG